MPSYNDGIGSSLENSNLQRFYTGFADRQWDYVFVALLMTAEFTLSSLIIHKVPYTEIDWVAYMEEVDFWMDGEYDYRKIYGNTGPLVYPAGFLYLFGTLQTLTNRQIPQAQLIFLCFYLLTQTTVLILYTIVLRKIREKSDSRTSLSMSHKVWSFRIAMCSLCVSKRFHSIFLLRLFNDGPTMLVTYLSFLCFVNSKWNIGCFLFSVAVSLKMNVLLFAPGLLYLLIRTSPKKTILRLAICGITQLILGAPFLLRYPVSYLRKAFELDRQFFFKWTVNLKFLPEELFLSKKWAMFLLAVHLSLLTLYFSRLYKSSRALSPENILSTLFVSNFIGICCARTLHYQFYCWYFSALPFLLWRETPYYLPICLVLLGGVEYAFLTYPATSLSSIILQFVHWSILIPCLLVLPKEEPSMKHTKKER